MITFKSYRDRHSTISAICRFENDGKRYTATYSDKLNRMVVVGPTTGSSAFEGLASRTDAADVLNVFFPEAVAL